MATVEHVWAESLFELAVEANALDEMNEQFTSVAEILDKSPEYCELLSSPTLSKDDKTAAVKKVWGGRVLPNLENFLCLLAIKGRIRYLDKIAYEWKIRFYNAKGIADAEVVSAVPLTETQKAALVTKLSKKYGKKIIIKEIINPAVIGGLSVRVGDELTDGTIKTKFENLQTAIKTAAV
jgi:F-type H+-transporting ATPase subunit delta